VSGADDGPSLRGARRSKPGRSPLQGDEADLFREFHPQLLRIVQSRVNTSPTIADDACSFAWAQFLRHQPDRHGHWRGWLITTAVREAWALHRAEAGHVSLARTNDAGEVESFWDLPDQADPRDQVAIRMRLREALQALARVPERRRAMKVLQVMGFKYKEIAEMRGLSYTRVNRLLDEANRYLREDQRRVEMASSISPSPRAARLDELERDAPRWLTAAIGPRPKVTYDTPALLAWRRAALAIDDYRRQYGHGLDDEPLGERPADREAARAFDLAAASIERVRAARSPRRRHGIER
jgi:RNA polymerase sigma factor (sigma-70 family)